MCPAVRLIAHHVVGGDLGAQHRVVPVLHRQKLVVVEHVRGACDVAGNEDAVGDYAVDVEHAAAGVAAHAPESGGQPGPVEPFDIGDRPQRRHHHIDIKAAAV
jgi:hypothetical protein